jgi:hypothetical protein
MHRLIPFLTVDLAACLREIRMPRRGGPDGRSAVKNVNPARFRLRPARNRRSKSALLAIRRSAPSPNCALGFT